MSTLSQSFSVCIGLVVKEEQETSYTILRARGCNVTLNGLKPNTAYLLQIRARTAAGYGASSPSIQFETSPDCKSSTHLLVLLSIKYRAEAGADDMCSLPQQSSQHLSVWFTVCTVICHGMNLAVVLGISAAFSISSENSQVVLIAISSAVAIILLTVLLYVLIGRSVTKSII